MEEGRKGGRGGEIIYWVGGEEIIGDAADLVPHTEKVWPSNDPINGTQPHAISLTTYLTDVIFLSFVIADLCSLIANRLRHY